MVDEGGGSKAKFKIFSEISPSGELSSGRHPMVPLLGDVTNIENGNKKLLILNNSMEDKEVVDLE